MNVHMCVCVPYTTAPDGKTWAELIPGCQGNKLVTISLLLIVFLIDGLYVLWFNVLLKTSRHNYNRKLFYSGFCCPVGLFHVFLHVCVSERESFIWMHLLGSTSSCQYFDLKLWPHSFWWSHGVTPRLYTHALALFHDISDCLLCIRRFLRNSTLKHLFFFCNPRNVLFTCQKHEETSRNVGHIS